MEPVVMIQASKEFRLNLENFIIHIVDRQWIPYKLDKLTIYSVICEIAQKPRKFAKFHWTKKRTYKLTNILTKKASDYIDKIEKSGRESPESGEIEEKLLCVLGHLTKILWNCTT